MPVDFTLFDGPRGGMSMDFVPSHDCKYDHQSYFRDRKAPHTFSLSENAYLFIEQAVAAEWPAYGINSHWGVSGIPAEAWSRILHRFAALRFDIRAGVHPALLIKKHVQYPSLFMPTIPRTLHRRALLAFLDSFEARVRYLTAIHPYLVIGGY